MGDWIPAGERDNWREGCEESHIYSLIESHEVADGRIAERDELIHELAEALRDFDESGSVCDCWRCMSPVYDGRCGHGDKRAANLSHLLARVEAYQKGQADG